MDPYVPKQLIEDALTIVRARYIFGDKAAEATTAIGTRLAAGDYDDMPEATLLSRVNEALLAACGDRHLRLLARPAEAHDATSPEEEVAAWNEAHRLANYRIARAERLDGNVGYLDLRGLPSPEIAGPAIAAAMELVAHTDALIFDLRRNRGGDPDGVQYWHSYLFPDSETHLNDVYFAETGQTRQYWSLAHVPGRRYLNRPVYVLISDFTFSAGEEFAYNLKALRRATLIGEVTRGGAHPSERFALSPTVEISVPTARAINPVTGTNWEKSGVAPDVAVPAAAALDLAYRTALQHVSSTSTSPTVRAEATAALAGSSPG